MVNKSHPEAKAEEKKPWNEFSDTEKEAKDKAKEKRGDVLAGTFLGSVLTLGIEALVRKLRGGKGQGGGSPGV